LAELRQTLAALVEIFNFNLPPVYFQIAIETGFLYNVSEVFRHHSQDSEILSSVITLLHLLSGEADEAIFEALVTFNFDQLLINLVNSSVNIIKTIQGQVDMADVEMI
jgi:hypothetical protein